MRRTWLIFSQAVTVAVAVLFVVATLKPEWLPRRGPADVPLLPAPVLPAPVQPVALPPGGTAANSYATAARRATPAVVSITARKAPQRPAQGADPWFRFFFGDGMPQQPQTGLGSGVIVTPDGYLLTNNHVVEGADDIEVQLADGRTATAKLVGTDPETDVAVLKIELDRLPAIGFADIEQLQVGDVVLAIGNPFGVGQTVTSGIVSALGRDQLGINTAIYSRSGGSLGIGFAIPVSTARQVMEGLIRDGQVTRGWIGVEPRELTPEIAQTLNLPIRQGVLITGVLQNGPASEGGIRPGDVVVKVADKSVTTTGQLLNAVAALKPKQVAVISVQRGERALELEVVVGQRPKARNRQPQ